jgi:hypothetical protein
MEQQAPFKIQELIVSYEGRDYKITTLCNTGEPNSIVRGFLMDPKPMLVIEEPLKGYKTKS